VVVAVNDVTDVVERRGERDDDALVRLVQSFVRRAVELDAAAFQQVVEQKRAISNDFDVFSPMVVVPLSSNRVDVWASRYAWISSSLSMNSSTSFSFSSGKAWSAPGSYARRPFSV
jgi:hypothetical protein